MAEILAVLTDIEGTTSSISFVKEVLFPYSKQKLQGFLKRHWEDENVKSLLGELFEKFGRELTLEEVVRLLTEWIDEDRKESVLKELQGLIWEYGYKIGELKGHIYKDAYEKLKEWYSKGIKLYVFSSGSVKAQKLLFSHTEYGDITYLFSGYFDTRTGSKKDERSYAKIAQAIGFKPQEILFLSDVEEELNAAKSVNMRTVRLMRDKEVPSKHTAVKDFYSIEL
ncbi:MAG: acireductone synthase [Hydrogenobacter sp.]|uniref:acireductone synthase n=1 Tax=Hydrogenobacter thermophilus TaxID=940 RepID=UPI0030F9D0E2